MTGAETQILINELQSKINQLPTKGTLKALEYRLDAILQANLDTFWLLICAILVFLMQAGFMCLESGLSRSKNSINVALKNVTDSISKGDVIETNIYTDQNWFLHEIHGFYKCARTSYHINKHKPTFKKSSIPYYDMKFSSDLNQTSLKNINKLSYI